MDMDFAVGGPLVRRLRLVFGFCPSTHAFARCFLQTPPRGGSRPCTLLALHLHQVGQKTFTSKLLSMPSTPPTPSRGRVPPPAIFANPQCLRPPSSSIGLLRSVFWPQARSESRRHVVLPRSPARIDWRGRAPAEAIFANPLSLRPPS